MDKATIKILTATALIVAGASMAMARGPEFGGEHMNFEHFDADGSGEITQEDLALLADEKFGTLDADGSGGVSEAEFVAAAEGRAAERAARMFARLDADGDGVLSRDALENRRQRGFGERMISRLDEDDSGGVSAEEFEAGMERMAGRGKDRRGGGKERGWGRWHN